MSRFMNLVVFSMFSLLVFFPGTSYAGPDLAAGRDIFEMMCARCHGYEGLVNPPIGEKFNQRAPSFALGERMGKSDEDLLLAIENGIGEDNEEGEAMPPWGDSGMLPIPVEDRISVLHYIRTAIAKGKVKE